MTPTTTQAVVYLFKFIDEDGEESIELSMGNCMSSYAAFNRAERIEYIPATTLSALQAERDSLRGRLEELEVACAQAALVYGKVWLAVLSGKTQPPAYVEASKSYFKEPTP